MQSLLLIWIGVVRGRLAFPAPKQIGNRQTILILIIAIACATLVGPIAGRTWQQMDIFGVTPDATAVATIALVVLASPPTPRALLAAPILWCVVSGGTLWALGSPEAVFVLLSGLAGLIGVIRPRMARDRSAGPTTRSEEGRG